MVLKLIGETRRVPSVIRLSKPPSNVIQLNKRKKRSRTKGIIQAGLLGTAIGLGVGLVGLVGATPVLAGASARVGATLGRGFFGSTKKTIGTLTGTGILITSPKARKFVVEKIKDPTKTGREIGKLIEDPSKLIPKRGTGTRENVLDFLKKAGLIGGAGALIGSGIGAVKRFRERRATTPGVSLPIPSGVAPVGLLPAPPSLTTATQPIGAVQQVEEEKVPLEKAPLQQPIIKINNNPEINIRFSKSKKFINQQVLVKQ